MAHRMRTLPFDVLLDWIEREYAESRSIFGIPESQFFLPAREPAFASELHGAHLTTPIGPAAGPHTQLAQNIVCAWLCGGRFIELKTVQVMDDLDIPRPCIDLADEGYNVEWSQELRLFESADEYVKAWALVHVLRRFLGIDRRIPFGTVFNMSVGYNLDGILSDPMQRFMAALEDASEGLARIREVLSKRPKYADLEIPDRIAGGVTLSTMHGCPPDEIEKIARYLIEERGLHTTVKLNPTLLGKETVLAILCDRLGFTEIDIPDAVFEHDLDYGRALELIAALKETAASSGRDFAVKLSNTLAMANHRSVLPGDEMYMSGRALFPVTVALFDRLVDAFDGDLRVSYSAGADALNVAELLAAGARPVTVASDLLKPGGYGRLGQFVDEIERACNDAGASDLESLARERRAKLHALARDALADPRYRKSYAARELPKVPTPLRLFDCIEAPCVAACAVRQDVPEYVRAIAEGDCHRALATILDRNPLPGVTGHVCTHLCQTRCTRNNYDEPVAIRKLKRFAAAAGSVDLAPTEPTGRRVAVIGSGPSGLSAAYFLALAGVDVTIYEARPRAGGMLALAPGFRLPRAIVEEDIDRIRKLGVTIEVGRAIAGPPEDLLRQGFDAVYIACGYAHDATLLLEGAESDGVFGAIDFLRRVAEGRPPELGRRVVVIGGGNTAMDAARSAQRLTGLPSTVLYRRTRNEMPAEPGEIEDLLAEGNALMELVSPVRIHARAARVDGVTCVRNRLGEPDRGGRRRPVPIDGSEFTVKATALLLATGQRPDLAFLAGASVTVLRGGGIVVDPATGRAAALPIYAGGDVTRGPSIIVAACADGRRAAESICADLGVPFRPASRSSTSTTPERLAELRRSRTRRSPQTPAEELPTDDRGGFDLVEGTYSAAAARAEAERCFQCSTLCDKCVEVCPNRANVPISVRPIEADAPVYAFEESRLAQVGVERVAILQSRQIVHIEEFCNACGNCTTFCVHDGKPFLDKARIVLGVKAEDAEPGPTFRVEADVIRREEDGSAATLTRTAGGYRFEAGPLCASLDEDGRVTSADASEPFDGAISLRPAIEMIVLLEGIRAGASHLVEASRKLGRGDF